MSTCFDQMETKRSFLIVLIVFSLSAVAVYCTETTVATPLCPRGCDCDDDFVSIRCKNDLKGAGLDLSSVTKRVTLRRDLPGPLANHTFNNLYAVEVLDLSDSKINFIQSGAFRGLTHLKTLLLSGNNLQLVDDMIFKENLHLEVLDLSNNHMTYVPDGCFRFLPNLRVLNVSNNRIQSAILGMRFQVTTQIQEIDFSWNPIEQIIHSDFSIAERWESSVAKSLKFSHCQLQFISPEAITVFKNIKHLDLSYNPDIEMSNMPAYLNAIKEVNLKSLDLTATNLSSKLNISDLTSETLGPLSITDLYLGMNDFSTIDDTLLSFLNIQRLDLSYNNLVELGNGVANLNNLQMLDMSHNQILTISESWKDNVHNLEDLNLSHNVLTITSNLDLTKATKLKRLDLSHNSLVSFEIPSQLTELEMLILSNNILETVNSNLPLSGLSSLVHLDLSNNQLTAIHQYLFRDTLTLHKVDFSGNKIERIANLAFVPNCPKYIDLSHNKLVVVQHFGWSKLIALDLSHNLITNIDANAFFFLKELLSLDLSHNFISSMDVDIFSYLTSLNDLNLSHNFIHQALPMLEILTPMMALHKIDLSKNNFTHMTTIFAYNSELKEIRVSENHVTMFSPAVFASSPHLTHVDFSRNPLSCDCKTIPLQQWLQSTSVDILGKENLGYVCHSPPRRIRNTVMDFTIKTFECDEYLLYFVIFVSIVATAMVGASSMAVSCFIYRRYFRKQNPQTENNNEQEAELTSFKKVGKTESENQIDETTNPLMAFREKYLSSFPSDTLIDVEFDSPLFLHSDIEHLQNGYIKKERKHHAKDPKKKKSQKLQSKKTKDDDKNDKDKYYKHLNELIKKSKSDKYGKDLCKHDKAKLKKLLQNLEKEYKQRALKKNLKKKKSSKSELLEKHHRRSRGNHDVIRMMSKREARSMPDVISYVNSLPRVSRRRPDLYSSSIPIYHVDHLDRGHHRWVRSLVDLPQAHNSSSRLVYRRDPHIQKSLGALREEAQRDMLVDIQGRALDIRTQASNTKARRLLERLSRDPRLVHSGYNTIATTRGVALAAERQKEDDPGQGLKRSRSNTSLKGQLSQWL